MIEVIYEDEYLIAINKPSGLSVHRSDLTKSDPVFALQLVRDYCHTFVYPIHRLDRPTSGVLLFAKSSEIAREMGILFQEHNIEKKYIAVVRGYTKEQEVIDYPLRKLIDRYGEPIRKSDEEQEAITVYRSLAQIELPIKIDKYPTSRYSLLELTPKTGRRHQLRRHLKHISHPIIGDPKYGKSRHNTYFNETYATHRLLLASTMLSFIHPITDKRVTIKALPTDSFLDVIKIFRFDSRTYLKNSR